MSRQPTDELEAVTKQVGTTQSAQSVLFLRIQAAADYYTTNKALMEDVPPVLVDIILDPFILNVFPESLVPTAAYILIIAIASFFIARGISNWLSEIAKVDMTKKNR
jgi:ABC-type methionine transport system permease subunit